MAKETVSPKDFLENIYDTTPDGIMVSDNKGYIIRVNRALEKMLGFSQEELIGKHTGEMSPNDEKHMGIGLKMLTELRAEGFIKNFEAYWSKKDGSLCPIELNVSLLKDSNGNRTGSVAIIRNISERKKAEEALRESDERFRSLIEQANDAIFFVNGIGTRQFWNRQAEELYGYSADEVLGKPHSIIVNHWHSLGTIWAVQAGKDVYVEKPVSHNVWEGRQIVNAARKYNSIVQTGTQSRSNRAIPEAIAWIREGNLGKITCARGLCYKRRPSIGKVSGPKPIPPAVDYDLWCGPAPKEPLMRQRLDYDWHWVWATVNGDLGNQGIHQMDIARWALGEDALSPRVFSIGGRFGYEDDGTTPNTQIVLHEKPADTFSWD